MKNLFVCEIEEITSVKLPIDTGGERSWLLTISRNGRTIFTQKFSRKNAAFRKKRETETLLKQLGLL